MNPLRKFGAMATACALILPFLTMASEASTPNQSKENDMAKTVSSTLRKYGTTANGTAVTEALLRNSNGVEVNVISYGGIITRLVTPDRNGEPGDIVLGMDSLADYEAGTPYFGALIGRYGNRIANGRFEIDGETFQLDRNDGDNHLHGGVEGFDKKVWNMTPFVTENSAGVVLELTSPDGDQGYPGALETRVVYELTDDDELDMRFHATTDKPTLANLTQHTYFNLAGGGHILDHELMIPADRYTPVGPGLIPTGELAVVEGTPFDFREAKSIGKDIGADNPQIELGGGYDHNFVLKTSASDELVLAGRVFEPASGRVLEVLTVEPGVQFYSGNFLDGTLSGKGQTYGHRSGFCLEPQHFPDSPNQPAFPSTTLRPGEDYETRIVYRFSSQ